MPTEFCLIFYLSSFYTFSCTILCIPLHVDLLQDPVEKESKQLIWCNTVHKLTSQERDECNTFLVQCHKRQLHYISLILQMSFYDYRPGSIVPQLSKCLKFEAVWGALTDQMI